MEAKIRLEQAKKDIKLAVEVADKEIAALEKQIAAEAEPKLRDEDYGYDKDGEPTIVLRSGDDTMYYQPVSSSYDPKYKPVVIIGNLTDDLKAMQETVTKIKWKCADNDRSLEIYPSCNSMQICVRIKPTTCMYIEKEDWPAFEMMVRQFGATLKRNK